MGVVAGLALGEAAIVAIALLLATYELWLFARRRRAEHGWAGIGSLAMAVYAVAMLLHYDADASEAVLLSRIEAGVFVVVGHCAPLFAASMTTRRFPVPRWLLLLSLVFWTVMIPWLAPADIFAQEMLLLDHPFPRVRPSPAYLVGVGWALSLASLSVYWVSKYRVSTGAGSWTAFTVAIGVWAATGAHDAFVPMVGLPFALQLFEYGFCAFGLIMVANDAATYMSMLSASERDFRGLIDRSPQAVFISRDEELVYANARAEELFGADAHALIGRTFDDLVHEDDAGALRVLLESGDAGPIDVRVRGVASNVPCEVYATQTRWDGRPAAVLIARDVAGSRALTARMMEADRLISVGTVAAAAGHEINNPLAYVLLHLEAAQEDLLRQQVSHEGVGGALASVETALGGARRIAELVKAIGFFSRPYEGRSEFDIRDVIDSAIAITSNEVRHSAKLVEDLEDGLFVRGNPTRVSQVFVNLLTNAAQAMKGNASDGEIIIRARGEGDRVVCEVSDTGPGIAPELLGRIFDPFFTTKSSGSGIGLDIARETVRELGGELSVESEVSRGSMFRVELPRASAPERPPSKMPSVHPPRKARLLIVDDEPELVRAIIRALRADADVSSASSATEAVKVIEREEPFDLVLSDLMMPDGSGMELYARVEERWPELLDRLVFMTGGAFSPAAISFREEVDNRIIDKPLDLVLVRELLYEAVESALVQGS